MAVTSSPVHSTASAPAAEREDAAPGHAPAPPAIVPASGLMVGSATDTAEVEADRMADRALAMLRRTPQPAAADVRPPAADPAEPLLARSDTAEPAAGRDHGSADRWQPLRRSALAAPAGAAVIGHEGGELPADLHSRLERSRPGGQPLPDPVRRRMETAFDTDLSAIRIHRGTESHQLNTALSARAFTTGRDIYFGRDSFRPGTAEGDHILAHEIAHTQQHSALRRSIRRLDAGVADTAYQAMTGLDYRMLTDIARRAVIVNSLAALMPGEQGPIEFVKQLVLTSSLSPEKIDEQIAAVRAGLTGKDTRDAAISQLSARLRKAKQRSSGEIYAFIENCRRIHTDYYRNAYQTDDAKNGVDVRELDSDAKKYDTSGRTDYQDKLKTKKKRLFGSKTVRHTLADVVEKVRTVAGIVLVNTHAPDRSPGLTGEQKTQLVSSRPRVGVVGAGPVGLMAALESRLQGADVFLFESRGGEYTRRQVLAIDLSTMAKMQKLGVKFDLLDPKNVERSGEGNLVAVRYIEDALRTRALELGIDIRTGWSFTGADKGKGAPRTTAQFSVTGDDKDAKPRSEHIDLDLLVLAAGPGITRGRNGAPSITDKMGFTFDVQEAKDYAAVGLFESNDSGSLVRGGASNEEKKDWSYRFNTPKVTYVLQQIPRELYEILELKRTDTDDVSLDKMDKIRGLIGDVATKHYGMQNVQFGPSTTDKGSKMPNVGVFAIEVQQARSMVNEKLGVLLIGDTAATPHPHSGSGYNTGVRELDALSDVVASLRTDALARAQARGDKGKDVEEDVQNGEVEESPSEVQKALREYDREVKVLTDQMVAKALRILSGEHARFIKKWMTEIEQKYGAYLASDFRHGLRFEAIKQAIGTMTGPASTTAMQTRLDYMMDARRELTEIERAMKEIKGS